MIAFADYTLERIPVAPAPAPAPTPEVRALSSSRQGHFRGAGGALGELWGSARYRDPPVHHSRSQAPAWERTAPEAPPRFQAEPLNHGGSQAGAWEPDLPCASRLTHFCEREKRRLSPFSRPVHPSRSQAPAWERTAPEAPPRLQAEPVNHGGSQAGAWESDLPCASRLTHFSNDRELAYRPVPGKAIVVTDLGFVAVGDKGMGSEFPVVTFPVPATGDGWPFASPVVRPRPRGKGDIVPVPPDSPAEPLDPMGRPKFVPGGSSVADGPP